MRVSDFNALTRPEALQAIADGLSSTPESLAFRLSKKQPDWPIAAIATQVKLRQNALKKLPSFAEAGCLLHPTAFEQATAEVLWPHKHYESGQLAVDIGFGCAADTLALARRYERVIAIERNELLIKLARFNFERLGVPNVEFVQADAESWLRANLQLSPQLVYIDPARRDARKSKLVALDQLSPNVLQLQQLFEHWDTRVLLKLSPLFQPTQAPKELVGVKRVFVYSYNREVKEVLVDWQPAKPDLVTTYQARVVTDYTHSHEFNGKYRLPELNASLAIVEGDFLLQTDPAISLAGQQMHPAFDSVQWLNRFGLGKIDRHHLYMDPITRWFRVQAVWPYSPKQLKRELKARQITRAECLPIGFPGTGQQLAPKLGLKLGGDVRLLFIELPNGNKQVILAEQL